MKTNHWQTMFEHVNEIAPLEACGLLAGKGSSVEAVIKVRNAAESPVRFRMDPQEQFDAFQWIESEGLDLIGIYHSHPSGPATVSATDLEEAAYEVVHIIWFKAGDKWDAHGYWIEDKRVSEVDLKFPGEQ